LGSHQVNCSGYLLDLKQEIALWTLSRESYLDFFGNTLYEWTLELASNLLFTEMWQYRTSNDTHTTSGA
jgi:hypothetical protein